jgi:hypothetical protein
MASIPFGIEFDRIAPPVLTTTVVTGYDAARSRRTIDFFFLTTSVSVLGRHQRLDGDGDPANGWNRRLAEGRA